MKKFTTSLNGYNKQDVNKFVAEVVKEYESMLNNLKEVNEQNKNLLLEVDRLREMQGTFNRAILAAEDASMQMKKLARDESKSIIDDAKKNASRIVNDALIKADRVENEAEDLRRKTIIFKRKLRQAIESELESIESIGEQF